MDEKVADLCSTPDVMSTFTLSFDVMKVVFKPWYAQSKVQKERFLPLDKMVFIEASSSNEGSLCHFGRRTKAYADVLVGADGVAMVTDPQLSARPRRRRRWVCASGAAGGDIDDAEAQKLDQDGQREGVHPAGIRSPC